MSHIMIWHHVHQILSLCIAVLKWIDLVILHWVFHINHDCFFSTFFLASLFDFTCSSLLDSELIFIINLINLWTSVNSVWSEAFFDCQQWFLFQLMHLRSLINVQCHQWLIMTASILDLDWCSKLINLTFSFNFHHWQWHSFNSWQLNCSWSSSFFFFCSFDQNLFLTTDLTKSVSPTSASFCLWDQQSISNEQDQNWWRSVIQKHVDN